jgi:hypothetical protein
VTPNEVREKIGLDEVEGGDELMAPKDDDNGSDIGQF